MSDDRIDLRIVVFVSQLRQPGGRAGVSQAERTGRKAIERVGRILLERKPDEEAHLFNAINA